MPTDFISWCDEFFSFSKYIFKAEDTQLELEKLLAYVKLQEHEVNTQKNLVLEKQQMFQKIEEEFKEETKKLKGKVSKWQAE